MARLPKSGYVVARDAIVINVGARPTRYGEIEVTDRRTGERVTIPNTDRPPVDDGDLGIPHPFKALQKVPANHPAVEECPGAFMSVEEAGDLVEA